MAKNEREVPQDLTSGFEELPITTSRPIDVFVTPSRTPTSGAVNDLISGLERLNPALTNYRQTQYQTFTKEEEDKAEVEFNKTKIGIKKAVKDGTIPAGASPEFINKWVQLDLKRKAREFKTGLFAQYNEQNVMEHPDPEAFQIFFDKYSAEFKKNNKLDGYDPSNLADTFLPNTMSAYEELNSQHINGRVAVIEKKAKEDLGNEIFDIGKEGKFAEETTINNYFLYQGKAPPEKNKRLIFIAEQIYEDAQTMIDAGLDTADAQKVIRDSVISLAIEYEDSKMLKLFDYLPTVDGARMSGTLLTQTSIKDAKKEITRLRLERIDQEEKLIAITDKKDTKAIIEGLTAHIDEVGIETITQKSLNQWFETGIVREDGETVSIDITKRSQLTTIFNNMKTATELQEEDDVVINDFYTQILENPNNPQIKKDLINALGTSINDTTFKAINTFHNQAVQNFGDVRLKTAEYKQIELDLDEILGDYASGNVDKQSAIIGVKELGRKANEIITNTPTISNEDFLAKMETEADKILVRLLDDRKIKRIITVREKLGIEGSYLQSLKKINETVSDDDRIAIVNLIDQQDEVMRLYQNDELTLDEFEEQINAINDELVEINKKYDEDNNMKPNNELPKGDIFGVPLKELLNEDGEEN